MKNNKPRAKKPGNVAHQLEVGEVIGSIAFAMAMAQHAPLRMAEGKEALEKAHKRVKSYMSEDPHFHIVCGLICPLFELLDMANDMYKDFPPKELGGRLLSKSL